MNLLPKTNGEHSFPKGQGGCVRVYPKAFRASPKATCIQQQQKIIIFFIPPNESPNLVCPFDTTSTCTLLYM